MSATSSFKLPAKIVKISSFASNQLLIGPHALHGRTVVHHGNGARFRSRTERSTFWPMQSQRIQCLTPERTEPTDSRLLVIPWNIDKRRHKITACFGNATFICHPYLQTLLFGWPSGNGKLMNSVQSNDSDNIIFETPIELVKYLWKYCIFRRIENGSRFKRLV